MAVTTNWLKRGQIGVVRKFYGDTDRFAGSLALGTDEGVLLLDDCTHWQEAAPGNDFEFGLVPEGFVFQMRQGEPGG